MNLTNFYAIRTDQFPVKITGFGVLLCKGESARIITMVVFIYLHS